MKKKYLCIWHGNCQDGFGAAWVFRSFAISNHIIDDVEFHAGVHQNPPPDVTDRHVIFVDFSYGRAVIESMIPKALSITIIDHHKTAMDDLKEWIGATIDLAGWRDVSRMTRELLPVALIFSVFDMERSGAGLTWDFFNPGVPRPKLIDHIEDRDLWRFKLPGTREIQANLFSYSYDFSLWDWLLGECENDLFRSQFHREGAAIERKHHKDIAELVQVVTRPMRFKVPFSDPAAGTYYAVVPAANLPYTLTSDAGHLLCERDAWGKVLENPYTDKSGARHPFAACYWITPEGVVFSLRSRDDGADVGAIAKLYGGGGHSHASGFRVPLARLAEFEP